MAYARALLKLSGEALMGEKPYGIDPTIVQSIAKDVSEVVANGTELAIVVGGGNIFRGLKGSAEGMDRATADYALSTIWPYLIVDFDLLCGCCWVLKVTDLPLADFTFPASLPSYVFKVEGLSLAELT